VTRRDVVEMLDTIEDGSGPVMADRVLAYVRKAFFWAATRDQDFTPPIIKGMARTKPRERMRGRRLDDQEIRDMLDALDQLGDSVPVCYPSFVRALLLTGQRRTSVSHAHSDEITNDGWLIPASRMKGKRPHLVPITAPVQGLLGSRKGFLFSSDSGKTAFSGYSKAKTALDRKIAELRKQDGRKPMPHWVLHDLRRTARSILSRYSTPDIAERVLGHVIPGVRGVYDHHEYADEKREALERLAAHVNDVVHPGQAVMLFSK
jgi:integrase